MDGRFQKTKKNPGTLSTVRIWGRGPSPAAKIRSHCPSAEKLKERDGGSGIGMADGSSMAL